MKPGFICSKCDATTEPTTPRGGATEAGAQQDDDFQKDWNNYNANGNAGGWEKVAFTSGWGRGAKWAAQAAEGLRRELAEANHKIARQVFTIGQRQESWQAMRERAEKAEAELVKANLELDHLKHWS